MMCPALIDKPHAINLTVGVTKQNDSRSRRDAVILNRLQIGHTRATLAHLGDDEAFCATCCTSLTVNHILIECPQFNHLRQHYVEEGDPIIADKGFNIGGISWQKKVFLITPPDLRKKQFTADEVKTAKRIAKVRIHVKRAIGHAKQFHLINSVIPLTLKDLVEPMFRVCCFLSNLDKPLVK